MTKLHTTYAGALNDVEVGAALNDFVDSLDLQPGDVCYGYLNELPGVESHRHEIDDNTWCSIITCYDLAIDMSLFRFTAFIDRV